MDDTSPLVEKQLTRKKQAIEKVGAHDPTDRFHPSSTNGKGLRAWDVNETAEAPNHNMIILYKTRGKKKV